MEVKGQLHGLDALNPKKETLHLLHMRLDGPYKQSECLGEDENYLLLQGFELQIDHTLT